MPSRPEVQRRIAAARADFLASGHGDPHDVSQIVVSSWVRSRSAGVDASQALVTAHQDPDPTSRLARCAEPVLRQLGEEVTGLPISIALTDSKARILRRSDTDRSIGRLLDEVQLSEGFEYSEGAVGTNGIGTVFESGQSVQIVGAEHFHEGLLPFACAGAPIRDPFSGRIEGVLDITCVTERSSPLMHSLARSATRDIEQNLFHDRRHHQQALFDAFLRADARTHEAVLAVGGGVTMGNTRAQHQFTQAEQMSIHAHARYLLDHPDKPSGEVELSSGKIVRLRATRVAPDAGAGGIVLQVAVLAEAPSPPATGTRPAPGLGGRQRRAARPEPSASRPPERSDYASPLWNRAADEIATALHRRQPLLVMGPSGSGKFTVVAETHHRVNPAARSVAIDAVDLAKGSHVGAEEIVRGIETPTLYIFRNIDELTAGGVQRLDVLLTAIAARDELTQVAATVSDASLDSDLPFRELLPHFDHAVTVPSLRYRPEDLPRLIDRVLTAVSGGRRSTVSPAALRLLRRHSWPGNLCELEEVLSAALTKRPVGEIRTEDLPGHLHQASSRRLTVIESHERDAILQALREASGNRVQAAAALGIARSSLYRKIKSYGITMA